MTNNTPDYEDNLYFDSQNTKNEQQKDLCITSEQLTEQWKKGELPEGYYYIKTRNETNIDEYIQWYKDHGIPSEKSFAYFNVQQVLAPVPSYEEWKSSDKLILTLMDHIKEKSDLLQRAMVKNAQLKELLKECDLWFTGIVGNMNDKNVGEHNKSVPIGNFEHIFKEFSQKIEEVLK